VIGNIYYVGTRTLSSYLITTPQGHILLNIPTRETRTIERFATQLVPVRGRPRSAREPRTAIREGDALVKELTGAQVVPCSRTQALK
jgi:metallo-beta-lactamase class B